MTHATFEKFGGTANVVFQYGSWAVLLRPAQVTLGALVLIHQDDNVRALADVPANDFATLATVCTRIESVMRDLFGAQKFNYLALMMVDPHVHFHVLSRYESTVDFADATWPDTTWPGPPDITAALPVSATQFDQLRETIKQRFTHSGT